jgi:membrane-associated phospholipid phosphatase
MSLDDTSARFFASLNGRSYWGDALFYNVITDSSTYVMPLVILAAAVWLTSSPGSPARVAIVSTFAAACVAVAASFALKYGLPTRLRPVASGLYPFRYTKGTFDLSAFPSDTLTICATFCAGLFAVSRRFGVIGLGWCVVVAIAKLYVGYHYPTDLMVGIALGAGCFVAVWKQHRLANWMSRLVDTATVKMPTLTMVALLFVVVQFGLTFKTGRDALGAIVNGVKQSAPADQRADADEEAKSPRAA